MISVKARLRGGERRKPPYFYLDEGFLKPGRGVGRGRGSTLDQAQTDRASSLAMMPLWLRRGVICRQFHATLMHRKRKGGNKAFEPKRPWAPRRSSNSRHSRNDGVHGEPNARRRALRRAEETAFNPAEVSLAMLDERADAKFAGVVEDLLSPLGYAELPGWPDLRKKDPDRLWNSIRAQRKRTTVLFPAQLQNLLDLYSYLIRVLSAHGRFSEAYAVVWNCEVTSLDTHLNDKAYTAVLHGAAISGCMDASDEVWQLMQSKGETPSSHAWSARLLALCRNHLMDRAQREVQVMVASGQCLSIVHYTTLMNGYVGVGNVTEAWRWWRKMIQAGIEPDVMTYTVMLKACAKGGLFEKAMGLMEELEMRQLLPTRYTFNALLRATASAPLWIRAYGGVIEGVKMRMEGYDLPPNEDTFCALLECYGSGGDADGVRVTVEELLHWMSLRKSAKPLHEQTYRAILSAWAKCMSAGEVLGVKPRYGCLPEQAALELKVGTPLHIPCCRATAASHGNLTYRLPFFTCTSSRANIVKLW
jgi:pentatricopeptide repeat protein